MYKSGLAYGLVGLDHLEGAVVKLATVGPEAIELECLTHTRGAAAAQTPLVDIADPLDLALEILITELWLDLDDEVARHHAAVLQVGCVRGRDGQGGEDGAEEQRGVSVEASHFEESGDVGK